MNLQMLVLWFIVTITFMVVTGFVYSRVMKDKVDEHEHVYES
ncbi:MAG: hypothetical protein QW560_06295 [Candidatus Nitrosocaldus sp.]